MSDGTTATPSCHGCRYWAPNLEGEEAREGVCRKLAEKATYYGSLITEANDRCDEWQRVGVYHDADGQPQVERRQALRNRINLSAEMRTAGGEQSVWLADISEYGAGISTDEPPAVGTRGSLKWSYYEVAFSVAWANESSCGVMFDAPISRELVFETTRKGALKNNRSAEPSRIALGHKRATLGKVI